jgi:Ca-activated chloride channel family protein
VPEKFRVGVVSFSTRASVAVPPTEDRALVVAALDAITPGEGTAIGDAVALSVRVGQGEPAEDGSTPPRAILLLSDGKRDGGRIDPQTAAEQARNLGVPVHTVLVGTPNGVVTEELVGGFQRTIRVPPDPETLQLISTVTGGDFYIALDDERLRAVYEELGSRLGERKEQREITDVFAAGSALLLLIGGALSAFLFRRVP